MGYRVPWLRRTAAAVGTAALVLGGSMPAAFAHDSVIGGSVKDGDQLDEFPKEITLEFSGIPKEDFNTFAVTNVDTGEKVFSQEPKLHERDLTIETPADVHPGPGNYQVGFQITSSDGHATRGEWNSPSRVTPPRVPRQLLLNRRPRMGMRACRPRLKSSWASVAYWQSPQ